MSDVPSPESMTSSDNVPSTEAAAAELAGHPYVFDEAETRRRMNSGEWYIDFGPGLERLAQERIDGKLRADAYNLTKADDFAGRAAMLQEIFKSCAANVWVEPPLFVAYGTNITIGDACWFNAGARLVDDADIVFEERVLVGPGLTVATAGHAIHPDDRYAVGQYSAPVRVEHDVWIGANVTLLPGVTVGHGSIIAAGAVVNKNVPPMCVVGGVPARILRRITDEDRGGKGYHEPGTLSD